MTQLLPKDLTVIWLLMLKSVMVLYFLAPPQSMARRLMLGDMTYPGCEALSKEDFKVTVLVDSLEGELYEPIKLALDMDNEGNVDIYFTERRGFIKKYDAKTDQVKVVADLSDITAFGYYDSIQVFNPPYTSEFANREKKNEEGMVGIILDPEFKHNGWIYITYTKELHREDSTKFTLSRFQYANDTILAASEVIIAEAMAERGRLHTGGDLVFDGYNDLWWATGDDKDPEGASGNQQDLRGKILRIHPKPVQKNEVTEPGPGKTYEIPDGNLFPKNGSEGRPEIYVTGSRNAYTIDVDPVHRYLVSGDVQIGLRFFSQPGSAGWGMGEDDPVVPETPRVEDADRNGCEGTGPIYKYDPFLDSPIKFPPHFDNHWIVGACGSAFEAYEFEVTEKSATIKKAYGLERDMPRPEGAPKKWNDYSLHIKQGPDGALYSLNYAGQNYWPTDRTSIIRLEYHGDCRPDETDFTAFEKVGCMEESNPLYDPKATVQGPESCNQSTAIARGKKNFSFVNVTVNPNLEIHVNDHGQHEITIYDLEGRQFAQRKGTGNQNYSITGLPSPNLYLVKAKMSGNIQWQKVMVSQ